ncbi:PREDICTED: alpha-2,8-sialyltransferase 8E-like, partial [Eurypyga helias]|uniref:alpha-2,8-sialyltransferase 8E-like n=1 Tax=Eurypyga helias TaxID=54383 RepID=UPI00052806A4
FSNMPNSISREEYVKPGLLKMQKLWVTLLAVAAVSLVSMCLLMLNERAELGHCCNASAWLAVTQDNTPLGTEIVYDGYNSKKLKVSSGLLEILPEKSPFKDPVYKTCAVVGNGGILRNSSCGSKIDSHQFVIRFNLPSVDFSEDVGRKSSIVTVNPSILQKRMHIMPKEFTYYVDMHFNGVLQLHLGRC